MALKYWYKAGNSSDNWSTVTNWWTTSGGPTTGGVNAGLPGTFDDVIFDSLSTTSATVTIVTTGALCNSINFTGFTGTLAGNTVGLQITNSLPVDESPDTPLFAWGSGMTVSFSGTVTFGTTGTGSGGWIYCNGKTFQGPVTFISPAATFTFKDIFRTSSAGTGALVTLTSGTISATEADVEFGRFTSIGTVGKNIVCTNLYLTGTGALYTLGTSSTNLISTITNLIVSNATTTAKTLLYNTQFGSTNLQLAGAGNISIALGTTFKPAVTVTNTGGATAIFNISASSTIASLVFNAGVTMTWTNTPSVTVTILNDLTLASSLPAPTLTPSLIFGNPDSTFINITLAGKSLVTGTLTLSAGSVANFLDSVSTNAAITINGNLLAYNNISTASTISVGTDGSISMYGSSITATTTTVQGMLAIFTNLSVTGAITLNAVTGQGTLNTNTYSLICSGTITLQNLGVLSVTGSCQASAITSTNGVITVNDNSTLTCTNVLSFSAGFISAAGTNSPIYAGSFATAGSGAKDINIIDFYLTGTGTLYTQTTVSNLTTVITNIYITSNLPAARSLLFGSVFGSANVYVSNSSSGTTTLALGTVFIPNVYINNTAVSTLSFTSCSIRSLEFITGTVVNWNNSTIQTLTFVGGNFKLAASMTVTATPAIIFNNVPGDAFPVYVYMNGQSLKSTLTINDGGGLTTNVYFKDDFVSTSSINISNAGIVAIERNFTATTFTSSLWTVGDINIGYNFSTNTTYPSVVNLTSITSSTTNGTKLILHSGSIICSGAIALSTDMPFIIGQVNSSTVSCTSFTLSTAALLVISRGSLTCSGAFSTTNGNLYLGRNNVGVLIPNISEVNITCSTFSFTGASSAIVDNANIINRITCTGTGTVFAEGAAGAVSSNLTVLINNTNNPTSNITFSGAGNSYRELIFDRGGSTATNTVNNSNTFTNLRDWGTAAHILQFGGGTTNYIDGAFDVKGSSGNLITLQRSSATTTFLQRGKGLVLCDYVTVINLNALDYTGVTAIDVWYAGPNSTVTSSTGWNTGGKVRRQSALGVG